MTYTAELAYLTTYDDRIILNLQENGNFFRIEISTSQLQGILINGVKMVCEEKK